LYLWVLGARWLAATTSFQDLLLNAVALAFITELDELLYHALVPEDIQVLVRSYKLSLVVGPEAVDGEATDDGVETEADDFWRSDGSVDGLGTDDERITRRRDRRLKYRVAGMVLTMLVIIGLPVIYIYHLQQVLPGYRWDVHAPCESRLGLLLDEL